MRCDECTRTFLTVSQYIKHCNTKHRTNNVTRYTCPCDDCTRAYHTSHSLRCHIKRNHPVPEVIPQPDDVSNEIPSYQWNSESTDDEVDLELLVPQNNSDADIRNFNQKMTRKMIELFADPSLQRYKVMSILTSTHSIYQELLSSMHKYHQSNNLINEETTKKWKFLCEGKLIMTEYRCVEYLKQNNLYIEAIPYVLDTHHSESYK